MNASSAAASSGCAVPGTATLTAADIGTPAVGAPATASPSIAPNAAPSDEGEAAAAAGDQSPETGSGDTERDRSMAVTASG